MGVVEDFNASNSEIILKRYLNPKEGCPSLEYALSKERLAATISYSRPHELHPGDFKACFELIESTSRENYKMSSVGWSAAKKKKEMILPDMRYLLFRVNAEVKGFLSFMVTYEDGCEVIYCYELHLQPSLRGNGVGRRLIEVMEHIGRKVKIEKAMLTVFDDNEGGLRFYEKLG
jgi:ribosomal protein S18 acetylase RimI-like enzyme